MVIKSSDLRMDLISKLNYLDKDEIDIVEKAIDYAYSMKDNIVKLGKNI